MPYFTSLISIGGCSPSGREATRSEFLYRCEDIQTVAGGDLGVTAV